MANGWEDGLEPIAQDWDEEEQSPIYEVAPGTMVLAIGEDEFNRLYELARKGIKGRKTICNADGSHTDYGFLF